MSVPGTIPTPENKQISASDQSAPWNPIQIFGSMFFVSAIGAGIILGINWKRLGKPEWRVKTILLSIIVPGLAIALAFAWMNIFVANPTVPIQVSLSVPYLALGINFGLVWALARLQNGAYKLYKTQGLEALSNYEYDLQGAVIFGISAALIIGIAATLIFPLLKSG